MAGEVELRLAVGEPELPVEPVRFNPIWYAVALVVVLGASGPTSPSPRRRSRSWPRWPRPPRSPHGEASAQPAGVDPALMEKGKALYEANCAACHQANGQGMPPPFPL